MRKFSPQLVTSRRRRLGKTQQKLSREMGLSQASISALERGRKEPRSGTLAKLADALGCSVDCFFAQ
jgi:transcriptional regulator with XRE-family HTH domain